MAIAVALLGCEHAHVPEVLGVIASEPDVSLAAVWSSDRAAIPGAVANYAVPSPETALGRADVAIVCAGTDERPALSVRAGQAGRPMLIAEPLAPTAAEAARAAREIARSRTPAYATLFLRELPSLRRLRALGAARAARRSGRHHGPRHPPGRRPHCARHPAAPGGRSC